MNPRDGRAWRIVRAWAPPQPYRATGAPDAERLVAATIRFLHPPVAGEELEVLTALRPVRDEIHDLSEEELLFLFDEASPGGTST